MIVGQYNESGELLAEYTSTTAAANLQESNIREQICKAIKGKQRKAGGYIWKCHDGMPKLFARTKKSQPTISAFDLDGNLIAVFADSLHAGEASVLTSRRIRNAALKNSRLCGLYFDENY